MGGTKISLRYPLRREIPSKRELRWTRWKKILWPLSMSGSDDGVCYKEWLAAGIATNEENTRDIIVFVFLQRF
jgi:hypothetical protein